MSLTDMATCPPSTALSRVVSVPPPARSRLLPNVSGELSSGLRSKLPSISLRLSNTALKGNRRRRSPVCYFRGNADKRSSWNTLEKGMGIEDVLRQQMLTKQYADDGSGGGSWFGGGGSWFRGGRWGSGGASDDASFREMLHEVWQVILATAGFVFLYVLLIEGQTIARLGKDILKFIFTGKKSLRLERTMDYWHNLFLQLVWGRNRPMTLTG